MYLYGSLLVIVPGNASKNASDPSGCRPPNVSSGAWYQNTCKLDCARIDSCNDATCVSDMYSACKSKFETSTLVIGLLERRNVRNGLAAPDLAAAGSQLELNDVSRLSSMFNSLSFVKWARKLVLPAKSASSNRFELSDSSRTFGARLKVFAGIDEIPDLSKRIVSTS